MYSDDDWDDPKYLEKTKVKTNKSSIGLAAIMLLVMAIFAMVAPVEARLAPAGNQYDREAMTKEAWFALTQQAAPYGPFQQGTVGNWNYLAYDVPSDRNVASRFQNNINWVGFTAMGVINGDTNKGYYESAGRGGQCLYFVNLLLYRSEADRRQNTKEDGYVCHYCWLYVNAHSVSYTHLTLPTKRIV